MPKILIKENGAAPVVSLTIHDREIINSAFSYYCSRYSSTAAKTAKLIGVSRQQIYVIIQSK